VSARNLHSLDRNITTNMKLHVLVSIVHFVFISDVCASWIGDVLRGLLWKEEPARPPVAISVRGQHVQNS
jgi:hypothetical protein